MRRSRQPRLACEILVSFVVISFPILARAEVADVTLKDLVARSDLIVLARVSKVEDGPADLQPAGDELPPVKVATAQVIETWKGKSVREVRYIASPTQICDIASAQEGERVVLFLDGSKPPHTIAHVGRGRMPLHDAEGRRYATLTRQIILPEGTPTISRTETVRIVLPSAESGKPERSFAVEHSVRAIEVSTLCKLVRDEARSGRRTNGVRP